jgi:hypothetical protein
MKNKPLNNPLNSKKLLEPIFLEDDDEDNECLAGDLDLPLFYTTQEQRDGMEAAMYKAKEVEKREGGIADEINPK